jgi:rod shape determining protein RodA
MRKQDTLVANLDWPLLATYLLLLIMGVATVYSTAFNAEHPNVFDFSQKYGKQIIWVAVSLFLGLLVFLIDADIYYKFAVPVYLFTLALLVIVLFMPAVNGARAWLGIGTMDIQPAEFAKIGTSLLLAKYMASVNVKQQNIQSVVVANAIILGPMLLILMQPDAGTFIVFTSFLFVMYREGITYDPLVLKIINAIPGFRLKNTWVGSHFILILFVVVFLSLITLLMSNEIVEFDWYPGLEIPGFLLVVISLVVLSFLAYLTARFLVPRRNRTSAIFLIVMGFVLSAGLSTVVNFGFQSLAEHQKDRIELFLGIKEDPDGEDYNRNRAMAAVGSGGFFGKGYNHASVSSVESNHVPESETDFIFCPFAEEWGFMGVISLVFLYLFMLLRIVLIAERQRSIFNRVYAYTVAMILFYHFAINIGMNIGFAPVIGIPLPFFSYGGSSMMSFSMMLFILLKLDSQRRDILR